VSRGLRCGPCPRSLRKEPFDALVGAFADQGFSASPAHASSIRRLEFVARLGRMPRRRSSDPLRRARRCFLGPRTTTSPLTHPSGSRDVLWGRGPCTRTVLRQVSSTADCRPGADVRSTEGFHWRILLEGRSLVRPRSGLVRGRELGARSGRRGRTWANVVEDSALLPGPRPCPCLRILILWRVRTFFAFLLPIVLVVYELGVSPQFPGTRHCRDL